MSDESVFESFIKENEIKTMSDKIGLNENIQQEFINKTSSQQIHKGFDNLNAKELLSIEDWVEEEVRRLSTNDTKIFEEPQKLENENKIKNYKEKYYE